MAAVVEIVDAIVDSLNGVVFIPVFVAVSAKTPEFRLVDLNEVRVSVVPRSRELSMLTRRHCSVEYAIDVGIHKKIATDDEVESLIGLSEQITDHLYSKDMASASYLGIANEPVFDPKMLREDRVFFSIVTVRYRKSR